jgi:hypothetical protein
MEVKHSLEGREIVRAGREGIRDTIAEEDVREKLLSQSLERHFFLR